MISIPISVQPLFVASGWHPGRLRAVDPRVPPMHPAHCVLAELGGLHVGRCGAGVECATSDIEFGLCEVEEDEVVAVWSELLASKLVGIAEYGHRHGWLLIDEAGRCFGASQIHDAFYYEGRDLGTAVERLLTGQRARPMLRPDQDQVQLYGETFARGHPAIFAYDQ